MCGRDIRAIVSIDPGIKNFAYTVLITTHCPDNAASSVSITLPDPGFLIWRIEKFNLTAVASTASKEAMYMECATRIANVCTELRKHFGERMRIDILMEMQLQTNTHTFPLVYYLLGFLKRSACAEKVFTISPRSKLAARVVTAVWRSCLLQFSSNRDATAHPFCSNSKATSLTFADAFIKAHGAQHKCDKGLSLLDVWNSPIVRQDKRDDLADSLLQAVALWAAPNEIEPVLQMW